MSVSLFRNRNLRFSLLSLFLLVFAIGLSIAAVVLISQSKEPGDSDSTWGLALFGLAVPTWVLFIIQLRSDLDWETERKHLHDLHTAIGNVNAGLDTIQESSSSVGLALEALASAITDVRDGVSDAIQAIDSLAAASERARHQVLLTELTSPGDHRGFHGQASRLSYFYLGPRADLSAAVLTGCVWDHFEASEVVLTGAKLLDVFFAHATANLAQFEDTDLTNAHLAGSFAGSTLMRATVNRTTFEGHWKAATFSHCYFESARFIDCDLREARFEDTDYLSRACFWAAELTNASFRSVRLPVVDFRWANLTDAVFTGIDNAIGDNLTTFEGALLTRTDFSGVAISALREWNLRGAIVDNATWPSGYQPADEGALVVGQVADTLIAAQRIRRLEILQRRDVCTDHHDWGSVVSGDDQGSEA
jgi:uncharacterized protein YjbI with pentapeptide repeats